ncbi:MAG: diphosphate--fructose-6-phosphate 1-phosphotransferase [Tissierellia bacterium]|nr:diphosphate--fructose-6-phosphate 1-phosphotransferase [Tissierellia bacterium]
MGKNLLIVHGGGPTAVINCSLAGAIKAAQDNPNIERILAAKNGMGGLLKEEFIDLTDISDQKLKLILNTPGSVIGTSRDSLYEKEYKKAKDILKKHNISYCLLNGGNGTMDTTARLSEVMEGSNINVVGIPKTMDNDLGKTDHSPGFASAARYMAKTTKEIVADVKGLPIHVVILESMGRNAGWVTAASALSSTQNGFGPDIILLPEIPFEEDKFLEKITDLRKEKSGIVVVASEGLKDTNGNLVTKPIFKSDRAVYYGDVGSYLASLVISKLNIKARNEKPGLISRASIDLRSTIDIEEAYNVGKIAVEKITQGYTSSMVSIKRISNTPYKVKYEMVDLTKGMIEEKQLSRDYISEDGFFVTEKYIDYLKPLVGKFDDEMICFNN